MDGEAQVPLSALAGVGAAREHIERVCLRAYDLDTVKHTCYRFTARHYAELSIDESGTAALVLFRFPSAVTAGEEERLLAQFHEDLLDQDLRARVSAQTEVVRNLILANAFANTSLVDDER